MHRGIEALQIANELIAKASFHNKETVLRNVIYRPIYKSSDMDFFQNTIDLFPDYMTWVSDDAELSVIDNGDVVGCVKYVNGCKVIHVPSYLQGLWEECKSLCGTGDIVWKQQEITSSLLQDISDRYDIVILTAGSGLFQNNNLLLNCSTENKQDDAKNQYPVTLVRGQALELQYPKQHEALLCGKYIVPTPNDSIIIGATHEFKKDALTPNQVKQELKKYTYALNPKLWDDMETKECNVLEGVRVQSNRTPFGRLPIFGKVKCDGGYNDNMWYLTGLSSRGVLYHGLYGQELINEIFKD